MPSTVVPARGDARRTRGASSGHVAPDGCGTAAVVTWMPDGCGTGDNVVAFVQDRDGAADRAGLPAGSGM